MDNQIQLVAYSDDESELSNTVPPKHGSKCVWGLAGDPFSFANEGFESSEIVPVENAAIQQLSLVVPNNEAVENALGAMLNATAPLEETFATNDDEQQQHNTARPKRQAALQAERALTMRSAKRSRNVPLAAANDQLQVMRAPKKPRRAFLSDCDESNGMAIERPISAQSSDQQQIVLDNPTANSLKVREAMGTDTAGNATADVGSVGNGTADEAMSTTSTYTARQRQNFNKKQRKQNGQMFVDAPAEKFGPRVRKNPKQGKYEVQAILATTTYKKDGQLRRIFYVQWLGYSQKDYSWVLSEWMDTQELVTEFTVNSVINWVFKAIRGEEVPEEIAEKLRTNPEYISLMNELRRNVDIRTTPIGFSSTLAGDVRQQRIAAERLKEFLKKEKIVMDA